MRPLPHNSSTHSPPLFQDGRRISAGDCALFKPPQDSPPFIGIIRELTADEDGNNLKLRVNWLYRPSDVKLRKGIFLEAAPNEVFYSFHKDEIPAASLLHPCKVAFLRKGVEIPSGISAFVCRRVYDIENKRLWWLTDKDYINEWQEEINNLLEKTRLEMHGVVPSGGRSPRTLNAPASTTQSKSNAESVQNSTSFSSHGKGKKRERVDQGCDPIKRERLSKPEDGESGQSGSEQVLKLEIAKITEKGGLVDFEGVEKLVQLMQCDGVNKKMNLAGRRMLVDVIAVTDRYDCLGGFVKLRGLPVLDEWLQDVRKGKIRDCGSPRDGEKSVEDFLLSVLCALDKLPVNLRALQTCNVGKSVNHLRTHKNSEIQRKARNLIDTWKKRVEAEMKMDEMKPTPSEVSYVGNRKSGMSAEDGVKSSKTQSSASKDSQLKVGVGESMSKSSPSPGSIKLVNKAGGNLKDPSVGMFAAAGSSDSPLTPIKEERSSISSHSQNNSHSCSSDHTKTTASSCMEDTKSSTTGSVTVSKSSSGARHRKSTNCLNGSTLSGGNKDTKLGKATSLNSIVISDKTSPTVVKHDKVPDAPAENGNNQRLIVRLSKTVRGPPRAADLESIEESTDLRCKASPLAENHDIRDRRVRMTTGSLQSNDVSSTKSGKDELSDEGIVSTACGENGNPDEGAQKIMELAKASQSILGPISRLGKQRKGSLSSMNALVESCVKISEASGFSSPEDDVGINLLASVAAGEITKSESLSPSVLERNLPTEDELCSGSEGKLRIMGEEEAQCQPDDRYRVGAIAEQSDSADQLKAKNELKHTSLAISIISTGDVTGTSAENDKQNQCRATVQLNGEDSELKSTEKPDELNADASLAQSTSHVKSENYMEIVGVNLGYGKLEAEKGGSCNTSDFKSKTKILMFDVDKKVELADGGTWKGSVVIQSEAAAEVTKVQKEENEKFCQSPLAKVCIDHLDNKSECVNPPSVTCNLLFVQSKGESRDESKVGVQNDQTTKPMGFGLLEKQVDASCKDILKMVERLSVSHVESQVAHGGENSNGPKLNVAIVSDRVELQTSDGHSSASAAGSDMTVNLDFDLNECIPSDDGSQLEPVKFSNPVISPSVDLSCPLPNPISSISGSFSTSITVSAAAKGSFVPRENLLPTPEELGWEGSAATSAFRPAESKRTMDVHTSVFADEITSKQCRPPLDFDLNETSVEDATSQGCLQASCSESMPRSCGKGGLDLDLNRIDEVPDAGVFLSFNNSTPATPNLPSRLALPITLPNGSNNAPRVFDLNDGPGVDKVGPGTDFPSNPVKSNLQFPLPIPGVRMNSPEFGNFSWFPPANSYPAITVPSILSGRGEQYVAAAGSQRILAPYSRSSFGPEMFRGAVLSSSPTLPFSSSGPFQYPGFPFETNFPLAANTFSTASAAYVDSSIGGPLQFPNIPPQLVGSTGLVPSPYHRPYMMDIPGGTNNVASKHRTRGGQLDLNTGSG